MNASHHRLSNCRVVTDCPEVELRAPHNRLVMGLEPQVTDSLDSAPSTVLISSFARFVNFIVSILEHRYSIHVLQALLTRPVLSYYEDSTIH